MKPGNRSPLRTASTLLALVTALALTACTGSPTGSPDATATATPAPAASATSTGTPPPTPTPSSSVTTSAPDLEELHQLYIASGLPCDWVPDEGGGDGFPQGEQTGGGCRDTENGIGTFASQADVEALLQLNRDSIEPGIFLVGDRWVVGSEHPEDLIQAQTTMGGDLWSEDSPPFDGF